MTVTGDESIAAAQLLARKEGIFTGISGGAGMASALKVCSRLRSRLPLRLRLPCMVPRSCALSPYRVEE